MFWRATLVKLLQNRRWAAWCPSRRRWESLLHYWVSLQDCVDYVPGLEGEIMANLSARASIRKNAMGCEMGDAARPRHRRRRRGAWLCAAALSGAAASANPLDPNAFTSSGSA